MVALNTAGQCELRNAVTAMSFAQRTNGPSSLRPAVALWASKSQVSAFSRKNCALDSPVRVFQKHRHVCLSSATESVGGTDINEIFKEAARNGDAGTIQELLNNAAVEINSSSPERSGWTALHLCSSYGHADVARLLLLAGADTEVRNNSGNTPLQFACAESHTDVVRLLLEAGADIYATSNDKGNAMDYAEEWGSEEVVDLLLVHLAMQRQAEMMPKE